MTALADQTCIPCQGGIPPLDADGIAPLLAQVPRWKVVEGHHPDLTLGWGYVGVEVFTHKIDGLHEADFILAAQIDRAFADL